MYNATPVLHNPTLQRLGARTDCPDSPISETDRFSLNRTVKCHSGDMSGSHQSTSAPSVTIADSRLLSHRDAKILKLP